MELCVIYYSSLPDVTILPYLVVHFITTVMSLRIIVLHPVVRLFSRSDFLHFQSLQIARLMTTASAHLKVMFAVVVLTCNMCRICWFSVRFHRSLLGAPRRIALITDNGRRWV